MSTPEFGISTALDIESASRRLSNALQRHRAIKKMMRTRKENVEAGLPLDQMAQKRDKIKIRNLEAVIHECMPTMYAAMRLAARYQR